MCSVFHIFINFCYEWRKVDDYGSTTPCHACQKISTPVLSSVKTPAGTFSVYNYKFLNITELFNNNL